MPSTILLLKYVSVYICMSVCLYVCLSACLSVCLPAWMSACLACLRLPACMYVCPSVCLYVCTPVCLSLFANYSSCSTVSGEISNCSYRLSFISLTCSHISSRSRPNCLMRTPPPLPQPAQTNECSVDRQRPVGTATT